MYHFSFYTGNEPPVSPVDLPLLISLFQGFLTILVLSPLSPSFEIAVSPPKMRLNTISFVNKSMTVFLFSLR